MVNNDVAFMSFGNKYWLYIPTGATPQNISKLLVLLQSRVAQTNNSNSIFAEMASEALVYLRKHLNVKATISDSYDAKASLCDHYYAVLSGTSVRYYKSLKTYYDGGRNMVFADLAGVDDKLSKIKANLPKIVRFTYQGGSGKGKRVVKLNEVKDNGTLVGIDLLKSTEKAEAFRTYNISKIVGEVEILS